MDVFKHDAQPIETWREGVRTRMRVSRLLGGHQLCIFEQYCDPGLGAPIHVHAVEEVLEVIDGRAEIIVGNDVAILGANQSVVIPAGIKHAFRNLDAGILHVRATLAASIFEAAYEDKRETPRRWSPA